MKAGFKSENYTIIIKEQEAIISAMERVGRNDHFFTQCLNVVIPIINNYLKKKGIEEIAKDVDYMIKKQKLEKTSAFVLI